MLVHGGVYAVRFVLPNLGAAVLEELQEFWDHHIEWAVQHVTVQDLGRVLADLLQSSESPLKEHTRNKYELYISSYSASISINKAVVTSRECGRVTGQCFQLTDAQILLFGMRCQDS